MTNLDPADLAAFDAILAARPLWRGNKRADTLAGIEPNQLLHAGPAFAAPAAITRPIRNSACVAAVFEGLAEDFQAAGEAIDAGEIRLSPAQDHGIVTPLAAVVSASMLVHEIVDAHDPARIVGTPFNGGSGPAMRLGICRQDVLDHLRWLNGPFSALLGEALEIDLIEIAAVALAEGDDGHGRTAAGTRLLAERLPARLLQDGRAAAFLAEGPSFFLNLWMAACKCLLTAANGIAGAALVTAAGGNGAEFGLQVAGRPGQWFTAEAEPPRGDLGGHRPERALGAIGDSAIVDFAGFGAMALSYAPAQQAALAAHAPADWLSLPAALTAGVHPDFGTLAFRTGISARRALASGRRPIVALGILDKLGEAGRLGGGIYRAPLAPFAEALEVLEGEAGP